MYPINTPKLIVVNNPVNSEKIPFFTKDVVSKLNNPSDVNTIGHRSGATIILAIITTTSLFNNPKVAKAAASPFIKR